MVTIVIHNGDRRWTAPTDTPGVFGWPRPAVAVASRDGGPGDRTGPRGQRGDWFPDGRGPPWYVVVDLQHLGPSELRDDDLVSWMARFEQAETVAEVRALWLGLRRWLTAEAELELLTRMRRWIQRIPLGRVGAPGEKLKLALSQGMGDDMPSLLHYTEETWREHDRQLVEQGIERGIAEGIEEGARQERIDALCDLAATRFGPAVADRLAEVLRDMPDVERIKRIDESLLRCESGEEFVDLASGRG